MKHFKKITAIFVLLAMLPIGVFGKSNTVHGAKTGSAARAYNEGIYKLLLSIGVLEDTFGYQYTKGVTRMEFARMALRAGGYSTDGYTVKGIFQDVSEDNEYAADIEYLNELGVVSGDGTNFAPDRNITRLEAIIMLLRLINYTIPVESNGGYPNGYIAVAREQGLLKNISSADELSGDQALVLIYNMLNMNPIGFGSMDSAVPDKTKTILSQRHDVYSITGVVNANSFTALGSASTISEGKVSIQSSNGTGVLSVGDTDIDDKIGYYLSAYYKFDEKAGAATCICYELSSRNAVTVIDLSNIVSKTASQISYYPENGTSSKSTLELNAPVIIYNGVSYASPLTSISFTGLSGTVTAINNNGGKGANVLIIDAYETYIVSNAISKTETFFGKTNPGQEVDISKEKAVKYEMSFEDGTEAVFADIEENIVVSVAKSLPASPVTAMKVILSRTRKSGTVTSIDIDENGNTILELDGVEKFRVLDTTSMPKSGSGATLFLDAFGNIAYTEAKYLADYQYGLMIKQKYNRKDDVTEVKVYTRDGKIEYLKLAPKVTIDAIVYKDQQAAYTALNSVPQIPVYKQTAIDYMPQGIYPIRFTLSENNEIRKIDTPVADADGNVNTLTLYQYMDAADTEMRFHFNFDTVIGFKVPVNGNTTMLTFSSGVTDASLYEDENLYDFRGSASISSNKRYNFCAFKVDSKSPYADFLLVFSGSSASSSEGLCMVKSWNKSQVFDEEDEEILYVLKGLSGGKEVVVPIAKDYESDFAALNVHQGDVISFTTDIYGRIDDAEIKLSYDRTGKNVSLRLSENDGTSSDFYRTLDYARSSEFAILGAVKTRYEDLIRYHYMDLPNDNKTTKTYSNLMTASTYTDLPLFYAMIDGSVPITVFDPAKGEGEAVYVGTYDDIVAMDNSFSKHSTVLLKYKSKKLSEVIVYNNLDSAT